MDKLSEEQYEELEGRWLHQSAHHQRQFGRVRDTYGASSREVRELCQLHVAAEDVLFAEYGITADEFFEWQLVGTYATKP